MTPEQRKKMERTAAEVQDRGMTSGTIGANQCQTSHYTPLTLRERLVKETEYFQQQSLKHTQREELLHLLDNNPDVARILDLIELVQR